MVTDSATVTTEIGNYTIALPNGIIADPIRPSLLPKWGSQMHPGPTVRRLLPPGEYDIEDIEKLCAVSDVIISRAMSAFHQITSALVLKHRLLYVSMGLLCDPGLVKKLNNSKTIKMTLIR